MQRNGANSIIKIIPILKVDFCFFGSCGGIAPCREMKAFAWEIY